MKIFRKNLGILLLTLLVASCGKSKSNEAFNEADEFESSTNTTEIQIDNSLKSFQVLKTKNTNLLDDYSNLKEFKEDINTYKIKFRSKYGNIKNTIINCEKMNLSERKRYVVKTHFNEVKEVDFLLEISDEDPNETNFLCEVKDNTEEIERIKIKLLKSYIVSKDENWNTFLPTEKIETLLIEKDVTLYSHEMSVILESRTFISLGGSIKTFPQTFADSTLPDNNGKSGGSIIISSLVGRGHLNVDLRGLNAGARTTVPPKNQTRTEKNTNKNGCIPEYDTPPRNESLCYGLKGHPGQQGIKGLTGFSGGDSGVFIIKIQERNDFNIQVNYRPGKSGVGGIGGEGGDGGEGGSGSYVTWHREASRHDNGGPFRMIMAPSRNEKKYPDGPRGDQGARGANGENGEDGKNLVSDIEIGDLKAQVNDNFSSGEEF